MEILLQSIVIVLIAAVVIMVAYMLFSKFSFFGKAIKAVSFNRDVAGLVGIPVPFVITLR